jgi:hypothetical protein
VLASVRPPPPPPRIFIDHIKPEQIRAEGVLDIGAAEGTSVLFVLTRKRLHLLHTTWIPDRCIDAYAIKLAVHWLEDGMSGCKAAENLGIGEATLRKALADAGYAHLNAERLRAPRVQRKRSESDLRP